MHPMTPRQAADLLWKLGANITAIPAGGKRPAYEWNNDHAPWTTKRQPAQYVSKLNWATEGYLGRGGRLYPPIETVGVICGINGWRWIDVDARKDATTGHKSPVPESVRNTLLAALELPLDYGWCGRSRSGLGWHIAFRCDEDLPPELSAATSDTKDADGGGTGVKIGTPIDDWGDAFSHVELRWEKCQTTLPSPAGYQGVLPTTPPTKVHVDRVVAAFFAVATLKQRKLLSPPLSPSLHASSPPAPQNFFVWDDAVRAAIRDRFDLVAWFQQELGGDTHNEPGGEVRILGHTGLLVNPQKATWYSHGLETGGDWADAVAHTRYGGHVPAGRDFYALVRIAADWAGVPLQPVVDPHPVRTDLPDLHAAQQLSATTVALFNQFNRSDQGNAEAMAAVYGNDFRFCHSREKWLTWSGSSWRIDQDGAVDRAMITTVRQRYLAATAIEDLETRKRAATWAIHSENNGKIEAALKRSRYLDAFKSTIAVYDADPFLVATPTATIDLHTGSPRPPQRADYLTMTLGTAYEPDQACPRWQRFLQEVFQDADLIAYIQRAVGYCLTGDTSEQKVFLCYGGGANGKSTFLEVLSWLLGDYAANTSFDTFDANRRSDATNDLAALKGRRLVTVIESDEDRRLAEARVKAVTGGDLITCRFLYGEFFSYRPQFKIWLAMNHKPVIRGTDRGIWRRLQLIPFAANFEGREDRTLRATLRNELPGILNWALEGLRAWQRTGLGSSEAVIKATREYQEESDQVGRWLTDNAVVDATYSTKAALGYADYTQWCEANGERPFTQNVWGRRLSERGVTRVRTQGVWHLIGFGLLSPHTEMHEPSGGNGDPAPLPKNPSTHDAPQDETPPEIQPTATAHDLPPGYGVRLADITNTWFVRGPDGFLIDTHSYGKAVDLAWEHYASRDPDEALLHVP